MRISTVLLFLFALIAGPAFAQDFGTCITGTAEGDLDVNNVFARTFNTGSLFFGNTTVSGDGYLVPQNAGTSPIFASGLWVGGVVSGDVRVAAATYQNFEFWPGPLGDDGRPVDPDDCSAYDRIYRVSQADIEAYDAGGTPATDLAEWPVGLGAPTVDADGEPVEATSLDQVIDLEAGERPDINEADQALWWIMNDVGNEHLQTESQPLGIEARVLAYAYDRPGGYGNSTFYDYALTYKGDAFVEDAYIGLFVDPDLGDASDDYVGSDPERGLGFAYNATNSDAVYGTPPPAVGYDFLRSPTGSDGESLGATSVSYFTNTGGASPTSDPSQGEREQFYNYLRGLWKDATPMTVGGDGYMTGGEITAFAFSADPPSFWSELNVDGSGTANPSGDRRFVIASGPVTLEPDEVKTFTVGILWALGSDHLDSVAELKVLSDMVQADFPVSREGEATPVDFAFAGAFPNPFDRSTTLAIELAEAGYATVEIYDVLGRRVDVLLDGPRPAGPQELAWTPGAALPSGVYLVRVRANEGSVTRTVVLQR